MEILDKIKDDNELNKKSIEDTMEQMFYLMFNIPEKSNKQKLSFKEDIINDYIKIIEKFLVSNFIESDILKVKLIDFVNRLNTQKEILEVITNKRSQSDLEAIAFRLGERAQSAFE